MRSLPAVLVTAFLVIWPGLAEGQDVYTVDPEQSELIALVEATGVAKKLAHNHVILAKKASGEIKYFPDDVGKSRLFLAVFTDSLTPDEDEMRKKHGLKGTLKKSDRKEIEKNLKGEDQLHAKKFKQIRFTSTKVEKDGGDFKVTGEFSLRGKTRTITVPVKMTIEGKILKASGSFTIAQSDYGYEPYSALLGAIRNKDEVEIQFTVTAKLREK